MNNCKSNIVLWCTILFISTASGDQLTAVKLMQPVNLDGKLSESIWQSFRPVTDFKQREPNQGEPASERSEVWIAYDDNALYVAARLHDTQADSIMALLDRRDNLNTADWFGVFIDSYNDKRSGNYFIVGPSGSIGDGVMYNDDWDDSDWDGVWEAKTNIDEDGWTVEMRIPLSQLRFQNSSKQVWGVNFRRDIGRKNEQAYLEYTPRGQSGFVSRFRELTGIEGIEAGNALEVRPFVTTKHERTHPESGDPFNTTGVRNFFDLGADVKYALNSNLILDATINPDFGQVEVDPAVVNLSDVESFFQEKRPFFIEGSSTFSNFGMGGGRNFWNFNYPQPTFFYSRRIGRSPYGNDTLNAEYTDAPIATRILGAGKITGKLGEGWNVGTIHALTAREFTPYQYTGIRNKAEIEPQTYYGVGRIQKDFNEGRQGLGTMATYTSRTFSDRTMENVLNKQSLFAGADGWTFLDDEKMWVVTGYSGVSYVEGSRERMTRLQMNSAHYFQRPDASHIKVDTNATALTGYTGRVYVIKQKGNTYFNSSFGLIDPNFEVNDLGFLSRTDVINMHIGGGYLWTEPEGIFRFRELGGGIGQSFDFEGNLTHRVIVHWGYVQFTNYYSINYNLAVNPNETFSNRRTRGGPLTLNLPGYEVNLNGQTDDRKDIRMELGFNSYFSGQTQYYSVYSFIVFRPAPYVNFSIGPQFTDENQRLSYIGVFDEGNAVRTFGHQYVFSQLHYKELSANIRLNWTFTPRLSMQLYIQPLISSGRYFGYKELVRPKSNDFLEYGVNGSTIVFDSNNDEFEVDNDGSTGVTTPKRFSDPNFNYKSLRGNAVLRWEYLPGSVFFFVWTQSRSDFEDIGEFRFDRSLSRMTNAQPDNIFMVKMSYYLNM